MTGDDYRRWRRQPLHRKVGAVVLNGVRTWLFVLYVLFWADAWNRAKWSLGTAAFYFLMSVLPTGGFFADRRLKREAEDAVIASRARNEGVVGA